MPHQFAEHSRHLEGRVADFSIITAVVPTRHDVLAIVVPTQEPRTSAVRLRRPCSTHTQHDEEPELSTKVRSAELAQSN